MLKKETIEALTNLVQTTKNMNRVADALEEVAAKRKGVTTAATDEQARLAALWRSMSTAVRHDLFVTDPVRYRAAKSAWLASRTWNELTSSEKSDLYVADPDKANAMIKAMRAAGGDGGRAA